MRDVKLRRFYLFFLLAGVLFFFHRNSHVILFHTHTQHQVNLVIGMRDIQDPEAFDWYQRYSGIKEILGTH